MQPLIFATRPSALARWQTRWVIAALEMAWPELTCQIEVITTRGDRILDRPLPEIGGKGLFTLELEESLLSGRVHVAVHSLKDLPVEQPAGLTIGTIPNRADPRDVLISRTGQDLDSLAEDAVVGTSSLRRTAQLLASRPGLRVAPLRGNVDTRVRKLDQGQYDAIVLAGAGIQRLGLEKRVSQWLPLSLMLPAPGQGALAVQCREEDLETQRILAVIEHPPTRAATSAERAFLAALGGGCALPVGALGSFADGSLELQGMVASPDGQRVIRVCQSGDDPITVGNLLAKLALHQGALEVLHA